MKFHFLFLFIASFLSGAVWSTPTLGLYEAEVPVADQSDSSRPAAMAEALRQVVVKVSGRSNAANSPALKEALKKPTLYVTQYSYRSNDGLGAELPLLMDMTFDKTRIDPLLGASGVTQWNTARPLTIVWLAVEQSGQRILVGAGDRGLVKEMLLKAAQRRGLPLRLPLLDATDQAQVHAEDVWGDAHNSIIQASQRYGAQAVLVGRLGQIAGGRWQMVCTLYQGNTSQRWNQINDKVEPLVAYGIDAATDTLASSATGTMSSTVSNELHWVVKGVGDMHSQRRVMDYLSSLRGVTHVQLEQVDGDSMLLQIITSSGEAVLQQQLSFDNRLQPLDASAFTSTDSAGVFQPGVRVYRLAP